MNMNRKAKQVLNWTPGRKMRRGRTRKNWTETNQAICQDLGILELTWEDALDVYSGGQRWLEETHCPMCCPARDGLRSKVRYMYTYRGPSRMSCVVVGIVSYWRG